MAHLAISPAANIKGGGKRQLLIFSFDLWLLLVFHTNPDLWRSLTAQCYCRDYRKEGEEGVRVRNMRLTLKAQKYLSSSFSLHLLFAFICLSPSVLSYGFPSSG